MVVLIYFSTIASMMTTSSIITGKLEQLNDEENAQCLDKKFRNCKNGVEGYIESDSPAKFDTKLHHAAVQFNKVSRLERAQLAHTCGPSLELPSTHRSYAESRAEFTSLLESNYLVMHTV